MIWLVGLAIGGELVRESRPAMGTVVGITAVVEDPVSARAAFDAAYAEIERWEALLSEWRPDSLTTRLGAGEIVPFPEPAGGLLLLGLRLEKATRGAFSLTWRDGALWQREDGAWEASGPVDLGGLLKGWLNDRAGEVLIAAGVSNFAIDAAGDVLAHGEPAPGRVCWPVDLATGAGELWASACLRDEALSSSDQERQPDHLRDAHTLQSAHELDRVAVVASTGALADGLATAIFVSGRPSLAARFGARALVVDDRGRTRGGLTTEGLTPPPAPPRCPR